MWPFYLIHNVFFPPCSVVLYLFIGMITKAVLRSNEEEKKEEEVKKTLEQHDSIVTQYKELIREQVKIHQTIFHSHIYVCARFQSSPIDILIYVGYSIILGYSWSNNNLHTSSAYFIWKSWALLKKINYFPAKITIFITSTCKESCKK